MRYLLQINGFDGTLLQHFGCECGRCRAHVRQANTSASLLTVNDNGETLHHLLFDIGHGVVDSLNASPYLKGENARLDAVALTHWHVDHTAELNRVCVAHSNQRANRGEPPRRVPLYCRAGTLDWLRRTHGYVTDNYLDPLPIQEPHAPGAVLSPLPLDLPGVTITPVSISHYTADRDPDERETVYSTAAYVIETGGMKAVLLWDIDSENEWLANPETEAEVRAIDRLGEADLLFIDTTFWNRRPHRTTHPSFDNVRRYARTLRPRQTFLMHLSGHPDRTIGPGYGWTNGRWTVEASLAWETDGLAGLVRTPHSGEIFDLSARSVEARVAL